MRQALSFSFLDMLEWDTLRSVRGQNQKAVMMLKFLHKQAPLQEFFTERSSYYDLQNSRAVSHFCIFFDCTC